VPSLNWRSTSARAATASLAVAKPPLVSRCRLPVAAPGSSTSYCHRCRSHLSAPHFAVQRWYTPGTSRPRYTWGLFTPLLPGAVVGVALPGGEQAEVSWPDATGFSWPSVTAGTRQPSDCSAMWRPVAVAPGCLDYLGVPNGTNRSCSGYAAGECMEVKADRAPPRRRSWPDAVSGAHPGQRWTSEIEDAARSEMQRVGRTTIRAVHCGPRVVIGSWCRRMAWSL
jgi:hypothetical protein